MWFPSRFFGGVFWTAIQLRETDSLPRPVVLVESVDAEELMGLVNKNEEAIVRIDIMVNPPRSVIQTQQTRKYKEE